MYAYKKGEIKLKEHLKKCKACGRMFKTDKNQVVICSDKCRFESKILKKTGGCWEWMGVKDSKGYGRFRVKKRMILSHRFSFEFFNKSKIRKGKIICHSCDNPRCVNPDHLWEGTHKDNVLDKIKKGRCKYASGEDGPGAKLTNFMALKIHRMLGTHQSIADKFCVKKHVVSDIKRNRTYQKFITSHKIEGGV